MNKAQLAARVAKALGISLKQAAQALEEMKLGIVQALKKGERFTWVGFGTWGTRTRAAREARNPMTGGKIKIPAQRVVYFRAGGELKETVKK